MATEAGGERNLFRIRRRRAAPRWSGWSARSAPNTARKATKREARAVAEALKATNGQGDAAEHHDEMLNPPGPAPVDTAEEKAKAVEERIAKLPPLPRIKASSFAGKPAPERRFVDKRHFFLADDLNYFSGAGAIGKTTIGLQLLAAYAHRDERAMWLGALLNEYGPALIYSAEEDADELNRRLTAICAFEGWDLADLDRLEIIDMSVDEQKALLVADPKNKLNLLKTDLIHRLDKDIVAVRPGLVFIDNKAQTVDADEISRNVATKTGNVLRHLGRRNRCGIIMAAHPSLTGLNSGTGSAGSTGWFNTGRNQVNMTCPADDAKDDGRRVLTKPKANYSASGQEINVVWDQGCYRCTDEALRADAGLGKADKAERVFLALLRHPPPAKHQGHGQARGRRTTRQSCLASTRAARRSVPRASPRRWPPCSKAGRSRNVQYGRPVTTPSTSSRDGCHN